jgi:integrase
MPNDPCEQPPKLLDQLRRSIRDKHYSLRTERIYVYWARWYIRFHGLRHPAEMGAAKILRIGLPWLDNAKRPAKQARRPTVLTREEIERIFAEMSETYLLIVRLLYGTGMRLIVAHAPTSPARQPGTTSARAGPRQRS